MNPNYRHTITLYNCLMAKDNQEDRDVWIRTVLQDCFYKAESITIQNGTALSPSGAYSTSKANTYTVRIPENKRYLPYSAWAGLEETERKERFTVSEGDIVVYGECSDVISGLSGSTATEVLLKNKPNAFMVTAFADNTIHMFGKHYRLGG